MAAFGPSAIERAPAVAARAKPNALANAIRVGYASTAASQP